MHEDRSAVPSFWRDDVSLAFMLGTGDRFKCRFGQQLCCKLPCVCVFFSLLLSDYGAGTLSPATGSPDRSWFALERTSKPPKGEARDPSIRQEKCECVSSSVLSRDGYLCTGIHGGIIVTFLCP